MTQINSRPDLKYQWLLSKTNTQVNIFSHQLPAGIGQFKTGVLMITNVCFLRNCWACCLCCWIYLTWRASERLRVGFRLNQLKSLLSGWGQEKRRATDQTFTPAENTDTGDDFKVLSYRRCGFKDMQTYLLQTEVEFFSFDSLKELLYIWGNTLIPFLAQS